MPRIRTAPATASRPRPTAPSRSRAGLNGASTSRTSSACAKASAAISTVQERNRDLLKALAREQPQLYAELGQAFVSRRESARRTTLGAARSRSGQRTIERVLEDSKSFSPARWNMPELVLPRMKPKPLRERVNRSCPGHRSWVRRHVCSVRGLPARAPIECAHVRSGNRRGNEPQAVRQMDDQSVRRSTIASSIASVNELSNGSTRSTCAPWLKSSSGAHPQIS